MRPHRYRHIIPAKDCLAAKSSAARPHQHQLSHRLMLLQSRQASKLHGSQSRPSLKVAPRQQRPPMSPFFSPLPPSHLHQCPPGSGGNTTGYTRFEQSEEQEALTCISLVLVLSSSFSNCPSLAAAVAYLCGEETSTTDKLPKQKRSIPTSAVARGPDLVPRRRLRLAQPALRLLGVAGMRGFHMPHPIYRTRTPLEASGRLC